VVTTKAGTDGRSGPAVFLSGVVAGLLVAFVILWGGMTAMKKEGVTVQVDTGRIAEQVRQEVRTAARRELPGQLQMMQETFVQRTTADALGRLATTKIDLGGFTVVTPPAVVAAVQSSLQEALRTGAERAARNMNMDTVADQLGNRAFALVQERLAGAFSDQRLVVQPWPGFDLPVRLVPR
jgi:hypothetical protein